MGSTLAPRIGKPAPDTFVSSHPDHRDWVESGVIVLRSTGRSYLVATTLMGHLATESCYRRCLLVPFIDEQGQMMIWPIRLTDVGERPNSWNQSALEGAFAAIEQPVRFNSNRTKSRYELQRRDPSLRPLPKFPDGRSVQELVLQAFDGSMITSLEDPILLRLQGRC